MLSASNTRPNVFQAIKLTLITCPTKSSSQCKRYSGLSGGRLKSSISGELGSNGYEISRMRRRHDERTRRKESGMRLRFSSDIGPK